MIHSTLPQGKTPEQLALWIQENAREQITGEFPLNEDEKHRLAEKSSLASRALDRLEEIKKQFNDILKEGTPDEDQPYDITIPPTKGTKILTANRKFADKQIEQGFEERQLYMIPWPEESRMVAVDIEGIEHPDYSRDMTSGEIDGNMPILKKEKKKKEPKEDSFMDEVDGELDL